MSLEKADRIEKYRTITTEVLALTLGLGAFSLSMIPRESLLDVLWAVARAYMPSSFGLASVQ